jgi:hypothetical protein
VALAALSTTTAVLLAAGIGAVGAVLGATASGIATYKINDKLERRREQAAGKVAMRLLEHELAVAAASADPIVEDGRWSSWNFERALRTWDAYRADAAGALTDDDDWIKVTIAFYAVEVVERGFATLTVGTPLDPTGLAVIAEARRNLYAAANALRQRMGMPFIVPGPLTGVGPHL